MREIHNYGDICQIKGGSVPIVDMITGGSPCQDLSVAGKRAGLDGERSGLFMEQIRIVKELRSESIRMRRADEPIRPRFMVWENVPGAFSSNNGEDFRCVLEEICKVADENAYVPGLEKGQRWASAGCIMGDGYSVAWRLHDAQYWGVPQRRKRICVLADFNGESAPKILFELVGEAEYTEANKVVADIGEQSRSEVQSVSESVSRNFEQGRETGQGIAGTLENSFDQAGGGGIRTFDVRISSVGTKNQRAHCYETDRSRSLDTGGENPDSNHGGVTIVFEPGSASRVGGHIYDDSTGSLRANAGDNQQAVCLGIDLYNQTATGEVSKTLNAIKSDSDHVPCVVNADRGGIEPTTASKASFFLNARNDGTADTLVATDFKDPQIVCYGLDRASFNQGKNAQFDFSVSEEVSPPLVAKGPGGGYCPINDTVGALCAADYKGVGNQYVNDGKLIIQKTDSI